ncbi:pleckstrin homology domain-containing family G member 3 isoform X2 [Thalassophryne amazonica]|uniref:pleckstrin homology domain-containing family G member 3 isoform X2 n=1 Tax=Thalassophryne amazonica TaxID=390379 RepID=UPI0014709837|nr:pleckstrin homology domain-containing family G member 3 isoform X2 [Thalassophryne amazonica]
MPEGFHSSNHEVPTSDESPHLSTASISSSERAPSATPSESSDLPSSGCRPVSLVSTLSSGSGSSRDDVLAAMPSAQVSDPDIVLGLRPAEGAADADWTLSGISLIQDHRKRISTQTRAASHHQVASAARRMAPKSDLSYLDRVIMEIIETERMYVRDLRMIVEDYLAHIIDQTDLSIRPEQVCALFGNIEDIYEFNSELLQALDLCNNDPVAIARCFVMKSEYFEIYTQYCTNYPNSVASLTECLRNKSLARFFRERQVVLKCSLPLGSYLLKPVQRILKYHLLLQEIAKHFDPEEEGYEVLEDAIYTMTAVAWYINDMKRKHEHAVRLQEVQSLLLNWKGPDLTTYGELVLEGTFKVHRAKNERTLFLFQRMLLITKRRCEHFIYKAHISCSTLMLVESAKDSTSFSVTHYKHPKQPHTVQAKTLEEKKLWAHHIKRLILENHHAVIPQKAKEAILEMDSFCPSGYRFSPERLRKVLSCQSNEFTREGRQGRRQSEPIKRILKINKATPKHADSDGTLPGHRHSLQLAISKEEARPHEAGAELASKKDSHEHLSYSEEEEPQETTSQPACENESDEMILEDDQDFDYEDVSSSSHSHLPEDEEPTGSEATCDEPPADVLQQEETYEFGPIGSPETEASSDPDRSSVSGSRISDSLLGSQALEPESRKEPSSTTPESDSKTLSSGTSSEDEDDGEAVGKDSEPSSILPSSVLDKASTIAQHFTNSIKRGSLPMDDARSLSSASPRLHRRTSSNLSLSAEFSDQPLQLYSSYSEPAENFSMTDMTLVSPQDDSLFDSDRGLRRRRDSTLSKQDQLLIGKIRSYYENASNQDATFGLQRRESLTYIPAGLVKSSISRFNSIPKDEDEAVEEQLSQTVQESKSGANTSCFLNPLKLKTDTCFSSESLGPVDSSVSVDSLKMDHRSPEMENLCLNTGPSLESSSQDILQKKVEDDDFRPSLKMIKVWQAMEQDLTRSHNPLRLARTTPVDNTNKNCEQKCLKSDLSSITEESTSLSPFKYKSSRVNSTVNVKNTLNGFGEESVPALIPCFKQLKTEAEGKRSQYEESNQVDSAEKANRTVLHLARQYSQRLRTTKLVVRQQSHTILTRKKSLLSVFEENEISGTSSLPGTLVSLSPITGGPLNLKGQCPRPTHATNSWVTPPAQACSPSPTSPPPAEGFSWPHVRELCSRYTTKDLYHIQNQMIPGKTALRRSSSCSLSFLDADGLSDNVPAYKPHVSDEECSRHLHIANSLDPHHRGVQQDQLQGLHHHVANNICDDYYIAAKAPLANDPNHNIIIFEKLPGSCSGRAEEEADDSYVQIRSPTSREKISLVAVMERCRAYQESEQKQRDDSRPKTESVTPPEVYKKTLHPSDQCVSGTRSPKTGQQNIVKNLREKFQSFS